MARAIAAGKRTALRRVSREGRMGILPGVGVLQRSKTSAPGAHVLFLNGRFLIPGG